jgi:hypothetical protein
LARALLDASRTAGDPLVELCRDRRLVTPELHVPNDYYGHATVLKRWAGLPAGRSLKVAVEHGVPLSGSIWQVDLNTEMPVFLCAGAAHARDYERRAGGRRRAVPIGPMFRYLPLVHAPGPRQRLLVAFPSHSTHRVHAEYDVEGFADRIAELGRGFDRVRVCMYWRDVLQGRHLPFRERGLECVSAGHMYDVEFLPRLLEILRPASMVLSNELGSQLLIATLLGIPVLLRRDEVRYLASPEVLADDAPPFLQQPVVGRILELFAEPRSEPSEEQRRLVEELCGAEHVRSPAELRALLEEAEAEYRRRLTATGRARNLIRRGLYHGRRLAARLQGGPVGGPDSQQPLRVRGP